MLNGVSRRLRRDVAVADGPSDLLIGDRAQAVVPCPSCGRPLARGQGRCPGCGTVLIAGVRLQAAGFLVLVGVMLGMIGGALVAGAAMAPRLAAGDAAAAELRAARPAAGQPVTAAPGSQGAASASAAPVPAAGLPDGVAGGLLQVAAVNTRLADATTALGLELAGRKPRSAEVAVLIRRVAADARAGADAARSLGRWDAAAPLAGDAGAFYAAIVATATDGLAAPIADRSAYVAAGRAMLAALERLPAIAAETGEVAALAGVELLDEAGTP
jgi:hypothetical protein